MAIQRLDIDNYFSFAPNSFVEKDSVQQLDAYAQQTDKLHNTYLRFSCVNYMVERHYDVTFRHGRADNLKHLDVKMNSFGSITHLDAEQRVEHHHPLLDFLNVRLLYLSSRDEIKERLLSHNYDLFIKHRV